MFRRRAEPQHRVWRERHVVFDVRDAITALMDDAAAFDDRDVDAGAAGPIVLGIQRIDGARIFARDADSTFEIAVHVRRVSAVDARALRCARRFVMIA